ncbi:MAG: hypothetical protein BGO95_02110 [Micrococcales bacterium 73-13]|nr:MAG: hypothetical protein BGO95_02110 [Micrococcales bacterium 73-13]
MTIPQSQSDPHETHERRTASIRRVPRYGVFIGLGAIVGILVTVAVTTAFPADPNVGMWATVAYMSLYGITGGVLLGALAALVADRVSRRSARTVTVERGAVEPAAIPSGPAEAADAAVPAADAAGDRP